jgi:hypothetical protein
MEPTARFDRWGARLSQNVGGCQLPRNGRTSLS